MWKMHEIRELIKLFEESSLQEMEIELQGVESQISFKKQEGSAVFHHDNVTVYRPQTVAVKEAPVLVPAQPKPVVESKQPEVKVVQEERPMKIDVDDPSVFKIVSPMVGTFYRAPGEDADPFVKVGDKVDKSTVVCILEAMKLFNEIEADVNGEVVDILVQNGQLVEHGQPLFLIKTQ
ncbi:acetyl-CoA carboxylase biotin carboxyl carrier protein [Neobacillus kokaensis]|uniref:Biotin carboxyl carrier protein of acetyl-CoA carboxylase n=1 Tax=Neobacillus kokaensis TaxID=2759023 RepID=A0ABQ3N4N9_9BACI|nr:acetyl-CoA carboxylase biotin carboxyl carrier protein [Neobacillus kokaensis]GHH97495.1 acetyl-CoA carboxylase, biotin carboxyl carrier protein [Neobacillus kokaensis]